MRSGRSQTNPLPRTFQWRLPQACSSVVSGNASAIRATSSQLAIQSLTASRTVTVSPSSMCSCLRMFDLSGSRYESLLLS